MKSRFGQWGEANNGSLVYADLGPTNTGKTHRAIHRMLELNSGMIGLPLRLLAREVYERLILETDERDVALLTGEERILPRRPKYYVCTVESMPMNITTQIVVVDEIQLASHPKRGHIFTDRLINARGTIETWFLGSDTMVDILEDLVPTAIIKRNKRMSPLRYIQPKRLSALPKRTAIVSFNITHLYELAERMRVAKGGVAIVMGAMSPQSRNAQVELFQSGKVDTLIATDAIGLGLNLDIKHVCFASTRKFDGFDYRYLSLAEMGQIAGRAGRYKQGGTFSLSVDTAQRVGLTDASIQSIEQQEFIPVRKVYYRHSDLQFDSIEHFWKSLQKRPFHSCLIPQREALDEVCIRTLLKDDEVYIACSSPERIELLWTVCRVPDYLQQTTASHIRLIRTIFLQLIKHGHLSSIWVSRQMERLHSLNGNIPKLLDNMAKIRTWNYIAHRPEWLNNSDHWKESIKVLENKLSETVHQRLTERFVDELGHVQERSVPEEVYREGEILWAKTMQLGVMDSLSFLPNLNATQTFGLQTVKSLGRQFFSEVAKDLCTQMLKKPIWTINEHLQICFQGHPIAKLYKGLKIREPSCKLYKMDLLNERQRKQVAVNVEGWIRNTIRDLMAIYPSSDDESRQYRYDIRQQLGTFKLSKKQRISKAIRKQLGHSNIICGRHYLYHKDIYKPKWQLIRIALYAIWYEVELLPNGPGQLVSFKEIWPRGMSSFLGYYQYAGYIIRADVIDAIRWASHKGIHLNTVASRLGLPLNEAQKITAQMNLPLKNTNSTQQKPTSED